MSQNDQISKKRLQKVGKKSSCSLPWKSHTFVFFWLFWFLPTPWNTILEIALLKCFRRYASETSRFTYKINFHKINSHKINFFFWRFIKFQICGSPTRGAIWICLYSVPLCIPCNSKIKNNWKITPRHLNSQFYLLTIA